MYCTTDDVYRTAGITSTEISEARVEQFILESEGRVDRFTNTTYWQVAASGTASAGAATTLTDSTASFPINEFVGETLWVYSGTGSGQARKIVSHTATAFTVATWTTNPDNTSKYRVIHTGSDPYKEDETYDGDDTTILFLNKYPVKIIEEITSNSTSVTPGNVFQYLPQGKLVLGSDSEVSTWTSEKAQLNIISYWYGVYPLPYEVKRLTQIYAALMCLEAQMGGTHNIPSTYSLPEGSVTIGQAYINIRGTFDVLSKEAARVEETIIKYTAFAA